MSLQKLNKEAQKSAKEEDVSGKDLASWKRVLMEWIYVQIDTGTICKIEQTDFDEFFSQYCKKHKVAAESRSSIVAFCLVHYPAYMPILNDENEPVTPEYVYIYTLLLHFSCVKSPEIYFKEVLHQLLENTQQYIAFFFENFNKCQILNKDSLQIAIRAAYKAHKHADKSSSSSANTMSIAMRNQSRPKAYTMEERTREMYQLRGQLATERYEKTVLEAENKKNTTEICKLFNEKRALTQQIKELQCNESFYCIDGNEMKMTAEMQLSTGLMETRKLNKRIDELQSQIQKKDEEMKLIIAKNQALESIINAANSETKESACAEAELKKEAPVQMWNDLNIKKKRSSDTMSIYFTDLNVEPPRKDFEKTELQKELKEKEHKNNELQKLLHAMELKNAELQNRLLEKDREKLGLQLPKDNVEQRPKTAVMHENYELRKNLKKKEDESHELQKELFTMRTSQSMLSQQIKELALQYTLEFNIIVESNAFNDADCKDPLEHFKILADCIQKLCDMYKEEKDLVLKLQLESERMQQRNVELCAEVEEYREDLVSFKTNMTESDVDNDKLQHLTEALMECQKVIELLSVEKQDLTDQIKCWQEECSNHTEIAHADKQELEEQLIKMQIKLADSIAINEKLSKINAKLTVEAESLQNQHEKLEKMLLATSAEQELKLHDFNKLLTAQITEAQTYGEEDSEYKEKYQRLLTINEEKQKECRVLCDHLDSMRIELHRKDVQMADLGNEILKMRTKNSSLHKRLEQLLEELKDERDEAAREKLKEQIAQLEEQQGKTQAELQKCEQIMEIMSHKVQDIVNVLSLPTPQDGEEILHHLIAIEKRAAQLCKKVGFKSVTAPAVTNKINRRNQENLQKKPKVWK